ncbi:MAG: FHA domain-containing protein [Verrucomicrobia bacterium]|jgi:hypothetical protein|nr:FHA domain-containing protein [Verrucomicrobiota bacterium]
MAKLVIRTEGLPAEVIELKRGVNRLGRSSRNDFQLEHHSVSRFHAEIELSDEWMSVRDMDSSNGVFVNGEQVIKCALTTGQVLRLGSVSLEVREAPALGSAPASGRELATCEKHPETTPTSDVGVENLSANTRAWQQRALAAERRAERAHAAIRSGVLSQLALWLRHTFVQGLISQRLQMLDAQQSAAAEMAELERRLDELHAPLQERLRSYEQRIAELEKSLAVKGEENRELLRARIHMTRQQLETQRARNRLEFN